jgi:hypothetical protein
MAASLRMRTRRQFGFSNRARLNRELVDAVAASAATCEMCRDIQRDVEADAQGGDYVEAPSFPGATIDRLDAHFKFHWDADYELLDGAKPRPTL